MPKIRSNEAHPVWCEMTYFEIVQLSPNERHVFARCGAKERLFVCEGECTIDVKGESMVGTRGVKPDLIGDEGQFVVENGASDSILVRVCGHWGEELGGSGVFSVTESERLPERGDPVDYPKATNFDNHYHDYDEYWIFYRGQGLTVSEGKMYEVVAGDCIATGVGHHHDIPQVYERLEGVFFETTIEEPKRRGHLWNHTHGPAVPRTDRI